MSERDLQLLCDAFAVAAAKHLDRNVYLVTHVDTLRDGDNDDDLIKATRDASQGSVVTLR